MVLGFLSWDFRAILKMIQEWRIDPHYWNTIATNINLLIEVLGFAIQVWQVRNDKTDAILESMKEQLVVIQERADFHNSAVHVSKKANLRTEPSTNGTVIRVIWPDEILTIVERRGDWVYVRVGDYRLESSISGWVNRLLLAHSQ